MWISIEGPASIALHTKQLLNAQKRLSNCFRHAYTSTCKQASNCIWEIQLHQTTHQTVWDHFSTRVEDRNHSNLTAFGHKVFKGSTFKPNEVLEFTRAPILRGRGIKPSLYKTRCSKKAAIRNPGRQKELTPEINLHFRDIYSPEL